MMSCEKSHPDESIFVCRRRCAENFSKWSSDEHKLWLDTLNLFDDFCLFRFWKHQVDKVNHVCRLEFKWQEQFKRTVREILNFWNFRSWKSVKNELLYIFNLIFDKKMFSLLPRTFLNISNPFSLNIKLVVNPFAR